MKLIHLSDLHLGKRIFEVSMLEDQRYILKIILAIVEKEKADGVLIAGDIYDKSLPPAEAVELFDDFLVHLAMRHVQVFVISGNHDSPERIAFGGRLMDYSGVHMSQVYNGSIRPITTQDNFGTVNIYMLPFIKPVHVRRYFPDADIKSFTDAMRVVIQEMGVNPNERNILITHQFVTGATRSESEEISVGGADNVDASVFSAFDYVALGHIHRPQNCGSERIRYCGTPLKYSFSEVHDRKSVTVVELAEKGNLKIHTVPFIGEYAPRREMRELRGTYEELTLKSSYQNTTYTEDYLYIVLTDEENIPDAIGRLRAIYHNLMKLKYDNRRTQKNISVLQSSNIEIKSPFELFADFYKLQNNKEMSQEQTDFMRNLIEEIWGENRCDRSN